MTGGSWGVSCKDTQNEEDEPESTDALLREVGGQEGVLMLPENSRKGGKYTLGRAYLSWIVMR